MQAKMKLSEAIMLGRVLVNFTHHKWYSRDTNCGCLIGMGMAAVGVPEGVGLVTDEEVAAMWPWLRERREAPDGLEVGYYRTNYPNAAGIISDMAYLISQGEMTLEQAVEWIRQNEPQETLEDKREIVEQFCDQLVAEVA